MGRPESDSSTYETDQPQEYQYEHTAEATQTQDDFSSHTYETNYQDSSQQDHYQSQYVDTSANNPLDQQQQPQQQPPPPPPQQQQQQHYPPPPPQQQQQQYPPPPPQQQQQQYPPPPPQQQQQQYPPPQANQGYGGQPTQPSQFPPQGPQTNPMYSNMPTRPAPYPPQGPQTNPTQPVQFPPQSPMNPAAYPPQGPQAFPNQPAQFPPQSPQINPMYQNGPNEPVKFPPQAFQNAYQTPQAQGQPQVVPFPPKSPVDGIPMQVMNQQQEAWTTGIFDCMDDPTNALITALFPCVTFGQVAEIVDNGQTTCGTNGMIYGMVAFCIAMPCIVSCGYRSKLRAKYGLIEDPAPDWLTHCLFEWCALCQEYRELNNRGLDPSIGWQGNIARQNMQQAQVGMVPPMNQRMMP